MRRPSTGYALAALASVNAALLCWALDSLAGDLTQYTVLFLSVLLVAAVAGWRAGLAAVGLGAALGFWLLAHRLGRAHAMTTEHYVQIGLFVAVGSLITVLAEWARRAWNEARARDLEDSLKLLSESRQRSDGIVQSAMDAIVTVDDEQRIVLFNPAAEKMFGCPAHQAIGGPIDRFIPERFREIHREHIRRFGQTGQTARAIGHFNPLSGLRADGEKFPIEASISQVQVGGRKFFTVILRDITERRQAEEAIRESERNYRIVADNTHAWEFWLSPEGRFLYNSPSCERVTGYDAEAFVTDPGLLERIVHPEDRGLYKKHLTGTDGACGTETAEFRVIRRDGAIRWIGHACQPVYDCDGRFLGVRGSNRDITEQKTAEIALRESKQRLDAFMRHLPGAAWIKDTEGRYVYANPELERMFGISLEQVRGKSDEDISPPETARQFRENDCRVLAEGGSLRTTEVLRQPDGVDHHFVVSKFALTGAGGEPTHVAGVAFDITERIQAEEALRQETAFADIIIGGIPGLFYVLDRQGRFVRWNRLMESLTGLTGETLRGMDALLVIFEEDREVAANKIREVFDTGEAEVEARFLAKDQVRNFWFTGRRMVVGSSTYLVGSGVDVTDRKQAEEELKAAKDSAERAKAAAELANRAKDHFLAVLSHELRTPLTPVVMGVSMLQDRPDLDPAIREILEMVRRNVEMEARLIDDLLDVTRIARGKVELQKQRVPLCSVIQRAVEVCQPDIDARGLHFGVDLGPNAPYWVEADVPRLQQVFWNLLKNAIKFTPHGGCVGLRCQPNAQYVVAEVSDSGIGIDPPALPRIFNAFEQAERSVTRQFGGLGLGLAISKALVEMHGGQIEAHSEGRDKGATFRVRLPLCTAAREPEEPAPVASPQRSLRPLRILLVEDHGVTAKMMQKVLTADGHTLETAGDVATALELADQHDFDLLVSDLGLPDGSGHDLIRQIRQRGRKLPGIALSGYGQEEDIRRSYAAGFATHLTKPASREQLLAAVAAAVVEEPTQCQVRESGPVESVSAADVFNLDQAIHRCADDREVFEAMVGYFFNEADSTLKELQAAVTSCDAVTVARVAHRFKGTVGYLGAEAPTEAIQLVEQAGSTGDLSSAGRLLDAMAHHVQTLKGALERYRPIPHARR